MRKVILILITILILALALTGLSFAARKGASASSNRVVEVTSVENVNEYEDALSVALKLAEGSEVDDKLLSKIARKLESKGYGGGDILRVLETIRNGKQILKNREVNRNRGRG